MTAGSCIEISCSSDSALNRVGTVSVVYIWFVPCICSQNFKTQIHLVWQCAIMWNFQKTGGLQRTISIPFSVDTLISGLMNYAVKIEKCRPKNCSNFQDCITSARSLNWYWLEAWKIKASVKNQDYENTAWNIFKITLMMNFWRYALLYYLVKVLCRSAYSLYNEKEYYYNNKNAHLFPSLEK